MPNSFQVVSVVTIAVLFKNIWKAMLLEKTLRRTTKQVK